jgi:hypothetical protein
MLGIYILTHRKPSKSDKDSDDKDVELADVTANPLSGSSPVAPPRRESLNRPRSRSIDFSVGFASLRATPMPSVHDDDAHSFALMEAAVAAVDGAGGAGHGVEPRPSLPSVSEDEAVPDEVPKPEGPSPPKRGSLIQGLLNMLPMHSQQPLESSDLRSAMLAEEGVVDDSPLVKEGSGPAGAAPASVPTPTTPSRSVHHSPRLPSSLATSPTLSPSQNPNAHYHQLLSPPAVSLNAVVFAAPPSASTTTATLVDHPLHATTSPTYLSSAAVTAPTAAAAPAAAAAAATASTATSSGNAKAGDDEDAADFNPF